jgi:hypothetical protein
MSAAMKRGLGPMVLIALSGWACGETRLLEGFAEGQTRIRLEPSEFVGSVTCDRGGAPGALRAYMVRFQLLNEGAPADAGVAGELSSGAAACDQAVIFPPVAGQFYGAEIYGFDRDLTDADLRVPNLARWRARCGHGEATGLFFPDGGLDPLRPTLALRGFTVPMRGCTTFDGDAPGATQIAVDQSSALGALRCGQGAGEVAALQATIEGVTTTAACGEPLLFTLPPRERYYTFELTGLELGLDAGNVLPTAVDAGAPILPDASVDASIPDPLDAGPAPVLPPPPDADALDASVPPPVGGSPRWRTQCVGRASPGLRTSAYCDPLQPLP